MSVCMVAVKKATGHVIPWQHEALRHCKNMRPKYRLCVNAGTAVKGGFGFFFNGAGGFCRSSWTSLV